MLLSILISFSLCLIGFLYASVGHGGASGYIAVLSLYAIPVSTYKPLILVLNILVAGIALYHFARSGYFKWKICRYFLASSVPLAYFGSHFPLAADYYHLLLGIALIIPIFKLAGSGRTANKEANKQIPPFAALLLGGALGFVSGMLNIGGGIFLSPLLILFSWANAKEAASASALFIVVNSASGLMGSTTPIDLTASSSIWFIAAALGGFFGASFGSKIFPQLTIRYLLSAVLTIASCKLIFFM